MVDRFSRFHLVDPGIPTTYQSPTWRIHRVQISDSLVPASSVFAWPVPKRGKDCIVLWKSDLIVTIYSASAKVGRDSGYLLGLSKHIV